MKELDRQPKHRADYTNCTKCGKRSRREVCFNCKYHPTVETDPEKEARILAHAARVEREEKQYRGFIKGIDNSMKRDDKADIKALEGLLRGKEPMSVSEVGKHLAISEKKLRQYFSERPQFYRVGGGGKFDPWKYGLKETM